MKKEEQFRKWLKSVKNQNAKSATNRISNCRNIEKHGYDLDKEYKNDKGKKLLKLLTYSRRDADNQVNPNHKIEFNGDVYSGTATLKSSAVLYFEFCEDLNRNKKMPYYTKVDKEDLEGLLKNVKVFNDQKELLGGVSGNAAKYFYTAKFFMHVKIGSKDVFALSKFCVHKNMTVEEYTNREKKLYSGDKAKDHIIEITKKELTPFKKLAKNIQESFSIWIRYFLPEEKAKSKEEEARFITVSLNRNINVTDKTKNELNQIHNNKDLTQEEKRILVKCRLGQSNWRKRLIEYWEACSITNSDCFEMLIASHIKPWSESSEQEKYDIYNGLLLTPNYDKLFDRHYISFDDEGNIMVSDKITDDNLEKLGISKTAKLNKDKLSIEHIKYLKYHRNKFEKQNPNVLNSR